MVVLLRVDDGELFLLVFSISKSWLVLKGNPSDGLEERLIEG